MQRALADKDMEIQALTEQIVDKERVITELDQTVNERDRTIMDLNAEIERLNSIIQQNGMAAGDLQAQLADY